MYNKKEYDKQWKIEHPEKVKEYRKRYKEKHPEKVKAYKKEWRKKNWDRIKEKLRERWKNRYKDCPWLKHLRYARYRCSSSGPYYKNGTKCLLTKEEIKDFLDNEEHSAIIFLGFGPNGLRSMYGCNGEALVVNDLFGQTAPMVKAIMGTIHD